MGRENWNNGISRNAVDFCKPLFLLLLGTVLTEKPFFVLVFQQATRHGILRAHGNDLAPVVVPWVYRINFVPDQAQSKNVCEEQTVGVVDNFHGIGCVFQEGFVDALEGLLSARFHVAFEL